MENHGFDLCQMCPGGDTSRPHAGGVLETLGVYRIGGLAAADESLAPDDPAV